MQQLPGGVITNGHVGTDGHASTRNHTSQATLGLTNGSFQKQGQAVAEALLEELSISEGEGEEGTRAPARLSDEPHSSSHQSQAASQRTSPSAADPTRYHREHAVTAPLFSPFQAASVQAAPDISGPVSLAPAGSSCELPHVTASLRKISLAGSKSGE